MKSIIIEKTTLLQKIEEIRGSDMEYIEVSICDEELDQNHYFPSFIHFNAYDKDGACQDFESVDALLFGASAGRFQGKRVFGKTS